MLIITQPIACQKVIRVREVRQGRGHRPAQHASDLLRIIFPSMKIWKRFIKRQYVKSSTARVNNKNLHRLTNRDQLP